jgi:A/G-specific adenine glycosylase
MNPEIDPQVFRRKLLSWYKRHERDLPWRHTRDPYKIWISEVMLQQTTVPAVIPYYRKWFKRFPDLTALNQASLQAVLAAWQGLGYYQRARNLHAAARLIMDHHQGKIPSDYDTLIKLPGFGPYTTAAVLSIAFDLPYPVLDANIRRLGMRILGLREKSATKAEKRLLEFLAVILPKREVGRFNQALMELGSLVCTPKNPLCHVCPVIDDCKAYAAGLQEIIPPPKKQVFKKISAVVAVIEREGKYLIQKRPPSGLLAGLWEFPGGKIEPGESPEQALLRELKEELGVDLADLENQDPLSNLQHLITVKHAYTQFLVSLHAYSCKLKSIPPLSRDTYRWITLKGMRRFPFPSGSSKIIRFLQQQENSIAHIDHT